MSFSVAVTSYFKKQAKRLLKKYPSLKAELQTMVAGLEAKPDQGESIGNNCYKIRLAIASKNKGKSGGARLITHVLYSDECVYLLSIYDKSELDNISDTELMELLKYIPPAAK